MLVKRGQKAAAPPGGAWNRGGGCPCRPLLLSLLLLQLPGTLAICFIQAQAPCLYQERHFSPGESWLDANCSKCFCLHPLGVGCCEMMQRLLPVDFPDWCEPRYDSQACTVSLVQKARPSLPCLNKPTHLRWGSGELKSSRRGAETPLPPPGR